MASLAEEATACALPYDEKFLTIRHVDDLQKICVLLSGVDRRVPARDAENKQNSVSPTVVPVQQRWAE